MMWNFRVLFIRLSEDVSCVWRQTGAIFSNDCEHGTVIFALSRANTEENDAYKYLHHITIKYMKNTQPHMINNYKIFDFNNNIISLRCVTALGILPRYLGKLITFFRDGLTHNQIDHILIDKRRHTSIVDIRTFRGADCNSDHYLVIGELRERLSVAKRVEQQVNITKFNILKLKDDEAKQNYQVEISNRFATLESSDEVEKELDVNSVWENIRDSIKIAAEQSIGYYETKKKKPWFDEDCCMVVERRKQAKLKFL
ncbi:hypothetical protein ANN_11590 [Periplaneta americana]|uniref:Uncharacterized protein n=1 Tax=Periplaneta americana TaxID=6978 RepID=A0ABQ8T5G1_PERAM|nr:hypothetical protein ANN_11590 [Periplaneta americana]